MELNENSIPTGENVLDIPVQPTTSDTEQIYHGEPDIDDFSGHILDSVGMLHRNARRYPVLKAEQEVELANKVHRGQLAGEKLEQLNGTSNDKQREQLLAEIKEGQDAKDLFISSNIRLVISVASQYGRNSTVEREDRIQMGMSGLIRAVEKFDPSKGFKFSTYATWWIRQAVQRGIIFEGRSIRLPVHTEEKLSSVQRSRSELREVLNREPTDEEISEMVGFDSVKFMDKIKPALGKVSLNNIIEDDAELGDFIAKIDDETALDEVDNSLLQESILQTMQQCLNERQYTIMCLYYGLDGTEPMSQTQIAKIVGLTPGGVSNNLASSAERLANNRAIRIMGKQALGDLPPPPKLRRKMTPRKAG